MADLTAARQAADHTIQTLAAKLRTAKLIGDQAKMQDILSAIDAILTERTALSRPAVKSAPVAVTDKPDLELGERAFAAGLRFYFGRQYEQAESQLLTALRNSQKDARVLYFLGLARLPQGKIDAAQDDFRQAAALEKQGLVDTAALNTMFERIQGPERQFINRFRN